MRWRLRRRGRSKTDATFNAFCGGLEDAESHNGDQTRKETADYDAVQITKPFKIMRALKATEAIKLVREMAIMFSW